MTVKYNQFDFDDLAFDAPKKGQTVFIPFTKSHFIQTTELNVKKCFYNSNRLIYCLNIESGKSIFNKFMDRLDGYAVNAFHENFSQWVSYVTPREIENNDDLYRPMNINGEFNMKFPVNKTKTIPVKVFDRHRSLVTLTTDNMHEILEGKKVRFIFELKGITLFPSLNFVLEREISQIKILDEIYQYQAERYSFVDTDESADEMCECDIEDENIVMKIEKQGENDFVHLSVDDTIEI